MNTLKFKKEDKGFSLESSIEINDSLKNVFDFFSEAKNLETLTPDFLNFKIITPEPILMKEGLLIDYKIGLHGIPLKWRSEITKWDPPYSFVDEQRKGPYKFWHHLHTFKEQDGKTLVLDKVNYGVLGGSIINTVSYTHLTLPTKA